MSKQFFLGFNWKLNPTTFKEGDDLLKEYSRVSQGKLNSEMVIFPPTPFFLQADLAKTESQRHYQVGSQDVSAHTSGAYTGELSAQVLTSFGLTYCLIGHSETRALHKLENHQINQKVQRALESNLVPVLCIGYSQDKSGINFDELKQQVEIGLSDLEKFQDKEIILAYEPVWAIGTGKTADSKTIFEVLDFVKKIVQTKFGQDRLLNLKLIYGGSVDDKNIEELSRITNVDGFLIGGASLKPAVFGKIIHYFESL
jgi:triosephosphate isomerase